MQTSQDLNHKLLNQHHDRLQEWSKHLLTMSAGILGLWAGLQANLPLMPAGWHWAPRLVWASMALSLCAGLWQQWANAMEPLLSARTAAKITQEAALQVQVDAPNAPLQLRRPPTRGARIALRLQTISFLCSFLILTVVVMLR